MSTLSTLNILAQQLQPLLSFLPTVLGLAIRPRSLAICVTLPLLIWSVVILTFTREPGSFFDETTKNTSIGMMPLLWYEFVVQGTPDKEKWHRLKRRNQKEKSKGDEYKIPQTFLGRLKWSASLVLNGMRGIGWSYEVKNVPEGDPFEFPRWKAIVKRIARAAYFMFAMQTLSAYAASTPHGGYGGETSEQQVRGLEGLTWAEGMKFSWMQVLQAYAAIEIGTALAGTGFLLFGWPVDECPPAGGNLREAYTVRKCWGSVWHQMFRQMASSFGLFIARDKLHMQKGTFGSKYVQLWAGFFVTGLAHSLSTMLLLRSFTDNGDFRFFLLQPVGIFIEDHLIEFGHSVLGIRTNLFWRFIGFVWVYVWFGLTVQGWLTNQLARGLWLPTRGLDVFGIGPPPPM